MSGRPVEPALKRKRITVACNSCRAKKAKCDGKRPICGRCAGYAYHCTWGEKARAPESPSPQLSSSAAGPKTLRGIQSIYQQLVQSVSLRLPNDARSEVLNCLAVVQAQIDQLARDDMARPHPSPADTSTAGQPVRSERYLGEISDVRFCHVVKQTAELDADTRDAVENVDNYDPDELTAPRPLLHPLTDMPERAELEDELQTYFNTIHFAYPFVSKPSFSSKLETLQAEGVTAGVTSSWLSLLYALLAIGAYYNSFREDQPPAKIPHQRLFQQSLDWSEYDTLERSLTQTSALLAQCFYLLATSQIDRCWASLGLAIRLGQSIGLHASMEEPRGSSTTDHRHEVDHSQIRGRVWYCLYVLDRLLALQVGRPPAISDPDCHVPIPHSLAELEQDDQEPCTQDQNERRYRSDYFTCMIEFSSIIGRVLRDTYHPRREMEASMESTKACDDLLLAWKDKLPRFLRFDIGHAFEKSATFKRQRNMLAIKFHHLRTLIYRPYLCYPHLKSQKKQALLPGQLAQIRAYGNRCAVEAQAIAHLMHNVTDTADIVMNYPWWQMISCLVCAGSVMVLADAFNQHESAEIPKLVGLKEDIETCVQVLHALSSHSQGAKLALGMMENIRTRGARISAKLLKGPPMLPGASAETGHSEVGKCQGTQQANDYRSAFGFDMGLSLPARDSAFGLPVHSEGSVELDVGFGDAALWPMVVPDAMNWPVEFLDKLPGSVSSSPSPLNG